MTLVASLAFQKGCNILSFSDANIFNSIYPHRIFLALVDVILVANWYAINVYSREP